MCRRGTRVALSPAMPLRPGTPVLARGKRWLVLDQVRHHDCQEVRLTSSAVPAQSRTLLVPFDRIEPLLERLSPRIVDRRRWAREVLRLAANVRPYGSLARVTDARIDLLPFQLEPALAFRRHGRTRIVVADDVGLGKTIQSGVILAELAGEQPAMRAIVLAPAGLRHQWRHELRDRFGLETVVADAAWLSSTARELPPAVNPWALPGLYVTSFDLVKRPEVLRSLEDVTWDLAVIDEAHACTRHTARRAAAHAIASRARRVVLLTATPPDGDTGELEALRSIGELPGDPPLAEFRRTRADVQLAALPKRSVLLRVRLSRHEARMHRLLKRYTTLVWDEAGARADTRARLAALVLRKRALSSAWSLGASVRRRLELLATPPAADEGPSQLPLPLLDEDLVEDGAPDSIIGAAGLADAVRERRLLLLLADAADRAGAAESKVRFLLRLVQRVREPLIVFTEYRDTLQHLERALTAAGHPAATLHGGMGPAERTEVQRAFNASGHLLLATDAASEGVNLHHRCRAVVHFELPWTLSRLRQRTGRVDRLGQKHRVHEILLVAHHTAERMVLEPLVRRAHLARRHDDRSDRLVDRLTETEIGAAVMEGRPVRIPPAPTQRNPILDLREEAIAESRRISIERAWRRQSGGAATADRRLLALRSRRPAQRLELVVAVRLEDPEGRVVHTSMAAVTFECRLWRAMRSRADWRLLATDLSSASHQEWRRAVQDAVRREVEYAVEHQRVGVNVIAARDTAILESHTSAARQLVQAGLFDRRALTARDRRRAAAAILTEDRALRAENSLPSLLRTTIAVLAIR